MSKLDLVRNRIVKELKASGFEPETNESLSRPAEWEALDLPPSHDSQIDPYRFIETSLQKRHCDGLNIRFRINEDIGKKLKDQFNLAEFPVVADFESDDSVVRFYAALDEVSFFQIEYSFFWHGMTECLAEYFSIDMEFYWSVINNDPIGVARGLSDDIDARADGRPDTAFRFTDSMYNNCLMRGMDIEISLNVWQSHTLAGMFNIPEAPERIVFRTGKMFVSFYCSTSDISKPTLVKTVMFIVFWRKIDEWNSPSTIASDFHIDIPHFRKKMKLADSIKKDSKIAGLDDDQPAILLLNNRKRFKEYVKNCQTPNSQGISLENQIRLAEQKVHRFRDHLVRSMYNSDGYSSKRIEKVEINVNQVEVTFDNNTRSIFPTEDSERIKELRAEKRAEFKTWIAGLPAPFINYMQINQAGKVDFKEMFFRACYDPYSGATFFPNFVYPTSVDGLNRIIFTSSTYMLFDSVSGWDGLIWKQPAQGMPFPDSLVAGQRCFDTDSTAVDLVHQKRFIEFDRYLNEPKNRKLKKKLYHVKITHPVFFNELVLFCFRGTKDFYSDKMTCYLDRVRDDGDQYVVYFRNLFKYPKVFRSLKTKFNHRHVDIMVDSPIKKNKAVAPPVLLSGKRASRIKKLLQLPYPVYKFQRHSTFVEFFNFSVNNAVIYQHPKFDKIRRILKMKTPRTLKASRELRKNRARMKQVCKFESATSDVFKAVLKTELSTSQYRDLIGRCFKGKRQAFFVKDCIAVPSPYDNQKDWISVSLKGDHLLTICFDRGD